MARQRALMAVKAMFPDESVNRRLITAFAGLWMDAFVAGIGFQSAGGHRDTWGAGDAPPPQQ